MDKVKLNRQLLEECEKDKIDYDAIRRLLKEGADPLGSVSYDDEYEHVYGELDEENKHLYELTKIFLENGMKIHNSDYADDPDNRINPLWFLWFWPNETGIKTLKLFLDSGIEPESAEVLVNHIRTDLVFVARNEVTEEAAEFGMKMIMLCASYKDILANSLYLQDVIDYKKNKYDVERFRDYDHFYMMRENNTIKEDEKGRITEEEIIFEFFDKEKNESVWKIVETLTSKYTDEL